MRKFLRTSKSRYINKQIRKKLGIKNYSYIIKKDKIHITEFREFKNVNKLEIIPLLFIYTIWANGKIIWGF